MIAAILTVSRVVTVLAHDPQLFVEPLRYSPSVEIWIFVDLLRPNGSEVTQSGKKLEGCWSSTWRKYQVQPTDDLFAAASASRTWLCSDFVKSLRVRNSRQLDEDAWSALLSSVGASAEEAKTVETNRRLKRERLGKPRLDTIKRPHTSRVTRGHPYPALLVQGC